MPGVQSNSTSQQRPEPLSQHRPEQWAEQRDPSAPRTGPHETASRSPEAKSAYPKVPAQPQPETDGRPGWLRRWAGESRRDTDPQASREGQGVERELNRPGAGPAFSPSQDRGALNGPAGVAGPSNGHTGHSIEAAFDFETVFHFETDLEAESTDDWLDLSNGGADEGTDEGLHESPAPAIAQDGARKLEAEGNSAAHQVPVARAAQGPEHTSENLIGHLATTEGFSDSRREAGRPQTSPDPKAVRAAIFRLAQQSHGGQISKLKSEDTAGAATEIVTPEGLTSEGLTSMTPDGGFAEVARRVWGAAGAGSPAFPANTAAAGYRSSGELSSPDQTAWNQHGDARNGREGAGEGNGLVESERIEANRAGEHQPGADRAADLDLAEAHGAPASGAESNASGTIRPVTFDRADGNPFEEQNTALPSHEAPNRRSVQEHREAVEAGGLAGPLDLGVPSTVEGRLGDPLSGGLGRIDAIELGQDENGHTVSSPDSPLESRQASTEARAHVSLDPHGSLSQEGTSERGRRNGTTQEALEQRGPGQGLEQGLEQDEAQGQASGGPALAHDASNLLSALKLYSELLALSGVLHARHKHYAEDLKLLASRSEALIDRLLASCTLAERQAQRLLQESTHRNAAETASVLLRSKDYGHDEPTLSTVQPVAGHLPQVDDTAHLANKAAANEQRSADLAEAAQRVPDATHETGPFAAHVGPPVATEVHDVYEAQQLHEAQQIHGSQQAQDFAWIGAAQADTSDLAAPESNPPGPVNLVDLLTRWGSLLSMIARGPVEVKFGAQAALPIRVAEEALERILVNLVHNAMTATRGGGAIRIGIGRAETRRLPHNEVRARSGNKMVLTVDDSGCGMTEEQIAKALGQDQRADKPVSPDLHSYEAVSTTELAATSSTSGDRTGTNTVYQAASANDRRHGMGLRIVRELVSASGGELAIFSRRGAGTRIEIQWPTVELASGLERIPPASVGGPNGAAETSRWSYVANARGQGQQLGRNFRDNAAGAIDDGTLITSTGQAGGTTQQRSNVALEGAVAC